MKRIRRATPKSSHGELRAKRSSSTLIRLLREQRDELQKRLEELQREQREYKKKQKELKRKGRKK